MADEEEEVAAAPEPVEEVEMSVLDALKEVSAWFSCVCIRYPSQH